MSPVRSVRGRLTLAITLVVGLLAVAFAALAPDFVRDALVDDLLDAQSSGMTARPPEPSDVRQDAPTTTLPPAIAVLDDHQLTELFGPALAELVTALDATGTLDELRSFRDDGTIVITPSPGAIAVVEPDGDVRVRAGAYDRGPVLTSRQLQQMVRDLDAGWMTAPLFDPGSSFGDWFGRDRPFPREAGGARSIFEELIAELDAELGGDPEPQTTPTTSVAASTAAGDLAIGVRSVDGVDLIVAAPTDSVDRTVDRLRTTLWGATPLMMALAGGLTWWLAGRSLRPVRLITDRTASIRVGTLHERVPVPASHDEVADLAREMNEMLDRLEREDARRRQFVSDASHELRSPIAAIQAQAEATLVESPDGEAAELAAGVLTEAQRLSVVVADLLALARHDEGLTPPGTVVDLDDVVIAEARRARSLPVDVSGVSAGRVRGRPDELARVVAHLLDNATRHARSTIRVELRTDGEQVTLAVDDDGPGVADADRERVFDRFVRLDEARLRDTGGAGLGLAVVAAVAAASGGSASVTDSALGGARFELRLPAAP